MSNLQPFNGKIQLFTQYGVQTLAKGFSLYVIDENILIKEIFIDDKAILIDGESIVVEGTSKSVRVVIQNVPFITII